MQCAALRELHCSVLILTTRGSTAAIDPWRSQGVVAPVLAPWGTLSCLLDKGLGDLVAASGIPTLAVVECRPQPVWGEEVSVSEEGSAAPAHSVS